MMVPSLIKTLSIGEKGLRYKLLIIEALIFVLPFFILFYIFYVNNIFLDFSQVLIFALILLIILLGLVILRQIFDRILLVSNFMKKAVNKNEYLTDIHKETAELHEISNAFNSLMKKYENTSNELGRRVFELFAIKELTEIASKSLNIDDLLNLLLEKVMEVTVAQRGSVFMVESEKDRFRVVGSKGLDPELEKGSYININESLARHIVSEKRPLLVQDVETDSRTQKPNDPKYGPPSFLSMPIFVRGNLLSILNLSHKETEEVFNSNDEEILSIMIGEIGFAMENAQLHLQIQENLKSLQERAEVLQTMHEQLKESNKNLGQAYSQMKDWKDRLSVQLQGEEIVFLIDENGLILGLTQRAIKNTEQNRRDLIRSNIVELVDIHSREALKNAIQNAWRGIFSKTLVILKRKQLGEKEFDVKLMHIDTERDRMLLALMCKRHGDILNIDYPIKPGN